MDAIRLIKMFDELAKAFEHAASALNIMKEEIISDSKTKKSQEEKVVKTEEPVIKVEEPKTETEPVERKIPKNHMKEITEFGRRLEQVRTEVDMTTKEFIEYVGFKSKVWNVLIRSNPYGKTRTLIENSMLDEKYKRLLLDNLPKGERKWKIEDYNEKRREEDLSEILKKSRDFIRTNGSLFKETLNMMFISNEIMVKGEQISPNVPSIQRICEILSENLKIDLTKIKATLIIPNDIKYWEEYYEKEENHVVGDFISFVKTFIHQLDWKTIDVVRELEITSSTWNNYLTKKSVMPAKTFYRVMTGTIGRQSSYKPMLLEVAYNKYNPDGYKKYLKLVKASEGKSGNTSLLVKQDSEMD